MSKYIDVEWLKQNFNTVFWSQITKTIDSAPSIDIVRCGECKLGGTEDCPMDEIDDEYYCNFGEREDE